VKSLPLPERGHVTVWDRPLGVRVAATGVKTYIVMLGSGRRHAIGRVGEISLKDARTAALQLKAEHRRHPGIAASVTLETARRQYLDTLDVRHNTRAYYERNLARLPNCRLSDIQPHHVTRILDLLGKTSRIQALRTYTAFFNWSCRRHYLDQSPCARMQADTSDSRSRVLTDEEIARIWSHLQNCSGALNYRL